MPPLFPLSSNPTGSYLVDRNGDPFLINGDTAWEALCQLNQGAIDTYLDDCVTRGFNAVILEAIQHMKFPGTTNPSNVFGDQPFTTTDDFSTPNNTFFNHVDYFVNAANTRNIAVFLFPAYQGFDDASDDQGWYTVLGNGANTASVRRGFGRYLGARYKSFKNVVWCHCGDRNPAVEERVTDILEGIQEEVRDALHTMHCAPETSPPQGWGLATNRQMYSISNHYSYDVGLSAHIANDRDDLDDVMPSFLIESRYEGEGDGTAHRVRRQMWYTMLRRDLGGCTGHFYGGAPLWYFGSGYASHFADPGRVAAQYMGAFLRVLRWWDLKTTSILTAGSGTDSTSSTDYATIGATTDGNLVVGYFPTSRSITVNRALMSGTFRARWFDPHAGTYSNVSGTPFTNTGTFTVTTPTNADAGDSVLLLQALDA